MSTTEVFSAVKQTLLEKLHQEIVPQLQHMVQALPEHLVDFGQAEGQLREGLLKVARDLLNLWARAADVQVTRPHCRTCDVAMRHRGYAQASLVTTVGQVGYRRPRWRCESCATESYPCPVRRAGGGNGAW